MATDDKPATLAGVVVAAGESPWEGRVKALTQARGGHATAVEHVVSVLGERCQPIFVVTSPGQSLPELSAHVVRDDLRGEGSCPRSGVGCTPPPTPVPSTPFWPPLMQPFSAQT